MYEPPRLTISIIYFEKSYPFKCYFLRSVNNVNLVEFVELFASLKRDKICYFNRRSTRRKNLHQKLVMSQMNAKKAAKLDMDDRAKIVQYFQRFFRLFILPFLHIFDDKSSQ
jgi:hypothetical protein